MLASFTDSDVATDSMEERDPENYVMRIRQPPVGRFLTLHKRRKKRLITRCLYTNTALLDDLMLGQVQVSTCACVAARATADCAHMQGSFHKKCIKHKLCVHPVRILLVYLTITMKSSYLAWESKAEIVFSQRKHTERTAITRLTRGVLRQIEVRVVSVHGVNLRHNGHVYRRAVTHCFSHHGHSAVLRHSDSYCF